MRHTTRFAAIGLCVSLALACNKGGSSETSAKNPSTDKEKTFYALGMSMGKNLSAFSITKDELPFLIKGLQDELTGQKPQVELKEFGPKIGQLYQERLKAKTEAEKEKSKAYLDQAAKESGAEKTESGLIYKELQAGTGAQPTATDTVKVHYKGTLTDGTEFDSSYKRNSPATFPLNGVIPCWTEGVQKMKVGGKAKLVCPLEHRVRRPRPAPDDPGRRGARVRGRAARRPEGGRSRGGSSGRWRDHPGAEGRSGPRPQGRLGQAGSGPDEVGRTES